MTRFLIALLLSMPVFSMVLENVSAEETSSTTLKSSELTTATLGTKANERPSLTKTARNAGLFLLGAALLSFLLKRKSDLFLPNKKTENKLKIIEQLSLGNSSALIVVDALGNNVLLSKYQGKIEFLTTLPAGSSLKENYTSSKEMSQGHRLEELSEKVQSIRVASQNAN